MRSSAEEIQQEVWPGTVGRRPVCGRPEQLYRIGIATLGPRSQRARHIPLGLRQDPRIGQALKGIVEFLRSQAARNEAGHQPHFLRIVFGDRGRCPDFERQQLTLRQVPSAKTQRDTDRHLRIQFLGHGQFVPEFGRLFRAADGQVQIAAFQLPLLLFGGPALDRLPYGRAEIGQRLGGLVLRERAEDIDRLGSQSFGLPAELDSGGAEERKRPPGSFPLGKIAQRGRGQVDQFRNGEGPVDAQDEGVGIVAAGLSLVTLGYAIVGLSKGLAILAAVVGGAGAALKLLGAVLAFLVTPIGLVITAVVAMGACILHATGAGAKALGWLGERFESLRDDAVASYQGIADALAAGDIALAAKILWLTLKMEWTKGINFLEKAWLNFHNFFVRVGYDAWHGLLATVEIVWHALEVGWIETTAFLSRTWTRFTRWVIEAWHWCGRQLSMAWNWVRKQFDSSFDAEAANRAAEEYYEAKKAEIEQETGRKLAEREQSRRRERERAAQVHEAAMAEIGRENLQKHQQLDSAYQQHTAENEADLARARKEWQDSVAEARRKRQAKEAEGPAPMEGPEDLLARVRGSLSGMGDLLATARERTVGVAGTFNAAALLGLQAGGAEDRIAAATERTARGIEGLRQDVRNNRAEFT